MTRDQVTSYGTAAATGGSSALARFMSDVAAWQTMDWLTAIGICTGILCGLARGYYDWRAHSDRKRGIERRSAQRTVI